MKTIKRISIFLVLCIFCIFMLFGCTTNKRFDQMFEHKNVVWKTDENSDVQLKFEVFEEKAVFYGCIRYGEQQYDINLLFGRKCSIEVIDRYGKMVNSQIYLIGEYMVFEDNSIQLEVFADYIFEGQLDNKTITIMPHAIDYEYNIGARNDICWETSSSGLFPLFTFQGCRYFSVGYYNGYKYDLLPDYVLYWLENKQFVAYEIVDGVQTDKLLLKGSYTNDNLDVTLTTEVNRLTSTNVIELKGRHTVAGEYPEKVWYPSTDNDLTQSA